MVYGPNFTSSPWVYRDSEVRPILGDHEIYFGQKEPEIWNATALHPTPCKGGEEEYSIRSFMFKSSGFCCKQLSL